jgi:ribosomal protein S18 acetylase RimI-like enzyme
MSYQIRAATPADIGQIVKLLPRLAAFDLPPERNPEDLWRGDAELLRVWGTGELPRCFVHVAAGPEGTILGAAITQLRDELLSHAPSAHLEILVVRGDAEGQGIGRALVESIEQTVREYGAESITLHTFSTNARARGLYERLGFTGELIRYIKHLA